MTCFPRLALLLVIGACPAVAMDPPGQSQSTLVRTVKPQRSPELQKIESAFLRWYNDERLDMAWLKDLPTPPDQLEFGSPDRKGQRKAKLPEGWEWDSGLAQRVLGYHPNAAFGIRSKTLTVSGAGQQATYDADGRLITGGISAGTPDRVSPLKSILGHHAADVRPYDLARQLDRADGGSHFRQLYLEVRPPCAATSASKNVVD